VEILLVEDNPSDVYLFRKSMVGQYHVAVAQSGPEALDRLFQRGRFEKDTRPDIVVIDLNIPLLNGHEVINVIKSNSALRSIPVVVLSGSSRPVDVRKAYELGASAYIVKRSQLAEHEEMLCSFAKFWFGVVAYPDRARNELPEGPV
jgi:CheY-like chemotaxis protein